MDKKILTAGLTLLFGCGGETSSTVFADAKQVVITSPEPCKSFVLAHGDEDDLFEFGASAGNPGLPEERVYAAIFKEYPQVQEGRIVVPADAVWVWHSGMRSSAVASTGRVRFVDGTGTDADGQPASLQSCRLDENCASVLARLQTGRTYYFAVWAWNAEREISYFSDRVAPFCITENAAQRGQACTSSCTAP
jgi:hypothetical protein